MKRFKNAAGIAAGEKWIVEISESDIHLYAPFNGFYLVNNSTEDIEIQMDRDPDRAVDVPKNSVISSQAAPYLDVRYTTIAIQNNHASNTIAANEIRIVIQKVVDPR